MGGVWRASGCEGRRRPIWERNSRGDMSVSFVLVEEKDGFGDRSSRRERDMSGGWAGDSGDCSRRSLAEVGRWEEVGRAEARRYGVAAFVSIEAGILLTLGAVDVVECTGEGE